MLGAHINAHAYLKKKNQKKAKENQRRGEYRRSRTRKHICAHGHIDACARTYTHAHPRTYAHTRRKKKLAPMMSTYRKEKSKSVSCQLLIHPDERTDGFLDESLESRCQGQSAKGQTFYSY